MMISVFVVVMDSVKLMFIVRWGVVVSKISMLFDKVGIVCCWCVDSIFMRVMVFIIVVCNMLVVGCIRMMNVINVMVVYIMVVCGLINCVEISVVVYMIVILVFEIVVKCVRFVVWNLWLVKVVIVEVLLRIRVGNIVVWLVGSIL